MLFGHEDDAEAAFADLFEEFVASDECAGMFRERSERGGMMFEECIGDIGGGEEGFDFGAELGIVCAGLVEIVCAVGADAVECFGEDLLDFEEIGRGQMNTPIEIRNRRVP